MPQSKVAQLCYDEHRPKIDGHSYKQKIRAILVWMILRYEMFQRHIILFLPVSYSWSIWIGSILVIWKHTIDRLKQHQKQMTSESCPYFGLSVAVTLLDISISLDHGSDGHVSNKVLQLETMPGNQNGRKHSQPVIDWLIGYGNELEQILVRIWGSSITKSCQSSQPFRTQWWTLGGKLTT